MDLTRKLVLYFNETPVEADCEDLQTTIDIIACKSYCAVYVRNDVPDDYHNKTTDMLCRVFSPDGWKDFRAYIEDVKTGLATKRLFEGTSPEEWRKTDAETLKDSGFRAGGFFFGESAKERVMKTLESRGYEIEKKY